MISMAYLPETRDHQEADIDFHNQAEAPIRYASLERVYSASTTGCISGSHSVMSKKVKAHRLTSTALDDMDVLGCQKKPDIKCVYSRRRGSKRPRQSFFDSVVVRREGSESKKKEVIPKTEPVEIEGFGHEDGGSPVSKLKKRKVGNRELVKLGVDSNPFGRFDGSRLRDCRNSPCNGDKADGRLMNKKQNSSQKRDKAFISSASAKKWVRLGYEGIDPKVFIGLQCKVFWPLDADWYAGRIVGYNSETKRHHVEYTDGDEEDLNFLREKIKFHISRKEMEHLNLKYSSNIADTDIRDYDEMVVLAATLDECLEFEPGDIIWAKLTGHAMWPAIVVDESLIGDRKGLNKVSGERAVLVQFFGTHDFARLKIKQVISFLKGLLSAFHQKCKQPRFERSMEEAKMYLSEHKLPPKMLQLRNGDADESESTTSGDESGSESGLDRIKNGEVRLGPGGLGTYQHIFGDLRILNLGKVVTDSKYFQNDKFVWPEGYTAVRHFTSIKDPNVSGLYKMEVLRDAESKTRPLFRVTADNGEQFKGPNPSACWNKIYGKIGKLQSSNTNNLSADREEIHGSGTDMFGFSNPKVSKLIQGILKSRTSSKFSMSKCGSGICQDPPAGYRPVRVNWKDLDKCNVCHMDEEYENNLFLQCDKCRMMVHARCYGELEPCDGVLWLCNLCRPGAPDTTPRCCLCPVVGGAMKPTTDGRWAHLACAIWIPETCLSDVKRMEPIDGINRVSKDRWKLLCSICGVSYGACIQCSNNTCRVAYHPLCARAAGLCVELEDEDRVHVLSVEDDDADQCIRLLSFCKRHRQPSNCCPEPDDRIGPSSHKYSDYIPPLNPSGCARTEPYNCFGRRGLKEPEALAAASSKRLYVANQPYIVGGYLQHGLADYRLIYGSKASQLSAPSNALSMSEKYTYMKDTYRKRLAFGKSGIHGFGIFAKLPHRAGDMVIEYSGELVRPSIADRREHLIYNSLVGAGTYMFRIDDKRVIDATRAGSIAHLINHSCEPNCYSRVISANGDEHIIIFAKRDIKRWEELTYDYRFFSIDERLACYCGFPRCRGIVNDAEAEEQASKVYAPRSDLIDWTEE